MPTLMLAYDLKAPGQDYTSLTTYLDTFGTYWHNLDSFWLLKTTLSAKELGDEVRKRVDSNNRVLVIDVSGRARAWRGSFSDSAEAWLRKNF